MRSFLGLRPGLGFAGMTHSLDANRILTKTKAKKVIKKREKERTKIPVAHNVEEEDMTGDGG